MRRHADGSGCESDISSGTDEEFQHAIETYQAESVELGLRFYRSVLAAVARIEGHPRAWPRLRGDVRKCLVEDFPYKLLHAIEPDRLHVVAVMHGKRPDYWIERLQ